MRQENKIFPDLYDHRLAGGHAGPSCRSSTCKNKTSTTSAENFDGEVVSKSMTKNIKFMQ
jgi:hypothetical protein